jgi:hypothetical protein
MKIDPFERDLAVENYRSLGMKTLQVDSGGKSPRGVQWQHRDAPPEDFTHDDKIGCCYQDTPYLDVDCDWDEAPRIADRLLPSTLTFGRPDTPMSHRVYRCPELTAGKKFRLPVELADVEHPLVADRDHGLLPLEINANGHAVWPPSPHEKSETYISFDGGREPSEITVSDIEEIEPGELQRLTGLVAFATVCAAGYPAESNRHDYVLAVCGALTRSGNYSDAEITAAIEAIIDEAGDDEGDNRKREVTPAQERDKLERGDPVTGLTRLCELMGVHDRMPRKRVRSGAKESDASGTLGEPIDVQSALIRTFRRWLADEKTAGQIEAIDNLNSKLAIMSDGPAFGKILAIGSSGNVFFAKPEEISRWYANDPIWVEEYDSKADKTVTKPVNPFTYWVKSPERRAVRSVEFEPPGSLNTLPEGALNLWVGFGVLPEAGDDHKPFLEHVWANVCHRDLKLYHWVMAWMADLVQQPGNKPGVVLVLRGKHGVGKTILLEHLRKIFGRHFLKGNTTASYAGRFNTHLKDKVCLGLEEALHARDKGDASVLKDLITSATMLSEQKFADPLEVSNHLHIVIAANHDWTVPVEVGDRRYMVLDVSDEREKDYEYFAPIFDALKSGKAAPHLLYHLQNYEYERELFFNLPSTAARTDQIERTLEPPEQWLLAVIRGDQPLAVADSEAEAPSVKENREAHGRDPLDDWQDKAAVFASFRCWADESKVRGADGLTAGAFWQRLKTVLGAGSIREKRRGGRGPRIVRFTGGCAGVVEAMARILECHPAELDAESDYGQPANDDQELTANELEELWKIM